MRATTHSQARQRGDDERSTATDARLGGVSAGSDLDDRWHHRAAGGRVRHLRTPCDDRGFRRHSREAPALQRGTVPGATRPSAQPTRSLSSMAKAPRPGGGRGGSIIQVPGGHPPPPWVLPRAGGPADHTQIALSSHEPPPNLKVRPQGPRRAGAGHGQHLRPPEASGTPLRSPHASGPRNARQEARHNVVRGGHCGHGMAGSELTADHGSGEGFKSPPQKSAQKTARLEPAGGAGRVDRPAHHPPRPHPGGVHRHAARWRVRRTRGHRNQAGLRRAADCSSGPC